MEIFRGGAAFGSPGRPDGSLWSLLTQGNCRRRRVTPMLAMYATATVVVTVAAGTRCAWYALRGPLDSQRSYDFMRHKKTE